MKRAKDYFSSVYIALSKFSQGCRVLAPVCAALLLMPFGAAAQDLEAVVTITSPRSSDVRIDGRFLSENVFASPENWAFGQSRTPIDRISGLDLRDRKGQSVRFRQMIPGEYLAETQAARWSYSIDLERVGQFTDLAHISWINREQGILMLRDVLPRLNLTQARPVHATIKFQIPEEWAVISNEVRVGDNEFDVADVDRAIFAVGRGWRSYRIEWGKRSVNIVMAGEWRFSDEEAVEMAEEILKYYRRILGGNPDESAQIILVREEGKPGRWEAETRGGTVTIVSGDMPFKKSSMQRLHEQFRHELLHLWIPNDLALTGNYDWFYEGFTVYQSLRAGVALNRISFDDFLATLAEAYRLTNRRDFQFSLAESSKNHQDGSNAQVYARGMIVAFITDAAILRKTRGRESIEDLLRRVYREYRRPNLPQESGAAILNMLKGRAELLPVVEKYVLGKEKIDWKKYLDDVGIAELGTQDQFRLRVREKPSRLQEHLLDKLGYNNWRKLSEKSK